jgi:serine/threonine protein kinase/WD40 repeat protein
MSASSLSDSGSTDRELDEAIMEFLRSMEDGTLLDIAALLEKHASVADELEDFINQQIKFGKITTPVREFSTLAEFERPATIQEFGDYDVIREIGRGGMGVIYEARQKGLSRRVALKMIRDTRFQTQEDLVRFQSESEAAAALEHPNIVPVYRVGSFDGQPFFTMKMVRGGSLKEALESGPMTPTESARIALAIARGVAFAHQRLILHRDLKPANILLDSNSTEGSSSNGASTAKTSTSSDSTGSHSADGLPVPMISDFGLAKQLDSDDDQSLTMTGAVLGTPRFMAPEQALGKETTTATDIYAVGAILYNMLTGEPPFGGSSPAEVARKVVEQTPKLIGWRTKIDLDLETICMKCLEKKPADRYGSASELAEDLENWLEGKPINARRTSTFEQIRKWARRHPRFATLLSASAALLMLTLFGAITFSFRLNAEVKKGEATLMTLKGQKAETLRQRDFALRSLFESKFAEVAARRSSGENGQQFGALAAAKEAVAQLPFINVSDKEIFELRSETAGCLGNADIQEAMSWQVGSFSPLQMNSFSPDLSLFAHHPKIRARFEVHRTDELSRAGSISESTPVASFDIGSGRNNGFRCEFSSCGRYVTTRTIRHANNRKIATQYVFDIVDERTILEDQDTTSACFGKSDSETLLATSTKSEITIFRMPGLEKIGSWRNPSQRSSNKMSFSPDGKWLARYGEDGAFVIDVATGEKVWEKHDLTTYFGNDLDWHPDSKEIVIATQTFLQIWNFESNPRLVRTIPRHSSVVYQVEYAAEGSVVACSSWGFTSHFWDAKSGEQICSFAGTIDCFSEDGRKFGFCNEKSGICEFDSGRFRRTISEPDSYHMGSQPQDLDVHPNDRWVAMGDRKSVRICDLKSGTQLVDLPGSAFVRFHPDGKSLFVANQSLKRWPIRESINEDGKLKLTIGPPTPIEAVNPAHRNFAIDIDPGGSHLAYMAPRYGTFLVNLVDSSVRPVRLSAPTVGGISVCENGRLVATGNHHGSNCRVFDGATGELLFQAPTPSHARCALSPDGSLLSVTYNDTADVYDTETQQRIYSIDELDFGVAWPSSFSKDGELLLFTLRKPRGTLIVDARTGSRLVRIPGSAGTAPRDARSMLTKDYQLITIKEGNSLEAWDVAAIRKKLAEIGLDWDSTSQKAPASTNSNIDAPIVEVLWGESRWSVFAKALIDLNNAWSWNVAEKTFDDWLADHPNDPELWQAKAVAKSQLGDQSALQDIAEAFRLSEDNVNPELYFSRAKTGRAMNKRAEVVPDLVSFLESESTPAETSNREEAQQLLAWELGLLGKQKYGGHSALKLAEAYAASVGRRTLARSGVRAWLQNTFPVPTGKPLTRDQVVARKTLGLALLRAGNPGSAKALLGRITPSETQPFSDANIGVEFLLAACEAELGNMERAQVHYETEFDSEHWKRWISLNSASAVDWSLLKSIAEEKMAFDPSTTSTTLYWSPAELIAVSTKDHGTLNVQYSPDSNQYVDAKTGGDFELTPKRVSNLFWNPSMPNQKLCFELNVGTAGKYNGRIRLARSWDYGRFEFELNGKPVGHRFDGQSDKVVFGDFVSLSGVELHKGINRLTIRNVGKSGDSRGFFLGVESVEFEPK